jgi:hypothetical protein
MEPENREMNGKVMDVPADFDVVFAKIDFIKLAEFGVCLAILVPQKRAIEFIEYEVL